MSKESDDWGPEEKLAIFQTAKFAEVILKNSEEQNEQKDLNMQETTVHNFSPVTNVNASLQMSSFSDMLSIEK